MIKLKKIIGHLPASVYKAIEETLVKNKADNFLFLLRTYRNTDLKDSEIIKSLNINLNSLYVLKSRLNDKIQDHLSGDLRTDKEQVLKRLHQVPEMTFGGPREVAELFLLKLEKDLLEHDLHNELLVVYSALKKLHLYSEKYFHYSQLYNRHVAFGLSIEKCEDILGSFNRTLAQYNFSRSRRQLDTLLFLGKEIGDHFSLHPSRQTELVKHITDLQLAIFCDMPIGSGADIEEVLQQTQKLINDLPASSVHKNWLPVCEYLFFEYYFKTAQWKAASAYYEKVNARFETLLLYAPLCLVSRFLISRLQFLSQRGEAPEASAANLLYDSEDRHSVVLLGIYKAMLAFYRKDYREAANCLNDILNTGSFKDFFHINTDVKLSLAYIYMQMKEYDLADSILKNISRKIKSEENERYGNVLALIKVLTSDIKDSSHITARQKDDFILFMARNKGSEEVLAHLLPELKKRYA